MESATLFKRLVWGLAIALASVSLLATFMITRPSDYVEHAKAEQHAAVSTWPDGSPRTSHDWWTQPGAEPPHAQG
jgi:hypothetical protein